MDNLAKCLRYYIADRLNNDPGWRNITVRVFGCIDTLLFVQMRILENALFSLGQLKFEYVVVCYNPFTFTQVFLSDASVPGEGEHKIMDFIRRQRGTQSCSVMYTYHVRSNSIFFTQNAFNQTHLSPICQFECSFHCQW